jgi:hypothetical protein
VYTSAQLVGVRGLLALQDALVLLLLGGGLQSLPGEGAWDGWWVMGYINIVCSVGV